MIRTLTAVALFAAVAAAPARAQDTVPLEDEYFAMKAYAEGLAEIAKSKLATTKATDPAVRQFAEKLVKDHTECNRKIYDLAAKKRIPLPTAIDAVHSTALRRMETLSASDFDKAFLKAQICAHKEALHLFEHQSHKGEDADLKALAHETIPTLQDHTKSAFDLAGEQKEYAKYCKVQDYAKQVWAEK